LLPHSPHVTGITEIGDPRHVSWLIEGPHMRRQLIGLGIHIAATALIGGGCIVLAVVNSLAGEPVPLSTWVVGAMQSVLFVHYARKFVDQIRSLS
jgi:hypothetical protein